MAEDRFFCLATFTDHTMFECSADDTWTVGRLPINHLVLNYPEISNVHCSVMTSPELGIVLTDTSSNGTWVNDILVGKGNRRIIHNGDKISFPGRNSGRADFVYHRIQTVDPEPFWDRFEKEQELGKGSFGTVHKCVERATGRPYAIKSIDRRRFELSPHFERRIDCEVEILKALSSRNDHIVHFKERFDHENMIYLVFEYIEGCHLGEYLQKSLALSESEVREIMVQVLQGVAFIHDQGIAHRDLKPDNILITSDDPPIVKITDFGLAKREDGSFLKSKCGTANFVAPEVLRNAAAGYNNLVDSWSVGVITYYLLTDRMPYKWTSKARANAWDNASGRKLSHAALSQSQLNCTKAGGDFIRRLLQEDPQARMSVKDALKHPWMAGGEASELAFTQKRKTQQNYS